MTQTQQYTTVSTFVPAHVPAVLSSETLGTNSFVGITEQGEVLLIRLAEHQQIATGVPIGLEAYRELALMTLAESQALYTWLRELDNGGVLRAEPVTFPAISNAYRSDGSALPETFGTVRVQHDGCWPDVTEWYLCSNRSLSIDRYAAGQYAELSQKETLQLLTWMHGLSARGLL